LQAEEFTALLLNNLNVTTYGSKDRYEAKNRLNHILRVAFPATTDDKTDGAILSGLLKPNIEEQIEFISEEFQIDFGGVPQIVGSGGV